MRVLLVEDDHELGVLIDRALTGADIETTIAPDGQRGLHLALTEHFDAMIVDRGLPAIEGLDLIGRLRSRGVTTPLLVLSARAAVQDRVDGLNAGAEDYLPKPFDVAELIARVRALLRRHAEQADSLPVPGGRLHLELRQVEQADGALIQLSERETSLLRVLASRPGQVFSRGDLRNRVFDDAESDGLVDTYVHYLRRKLGRGVVRTVRGVGYRLGGGAREGR